MLSRTELIYMRTTPPITSSKRQDIRPGQLLETAKDAIKTPFAKITLEKVE